MKNSTETRRSEIVSTVQKSQVDVVVPCRWRNSRQLAALLLAGLLTSDVAQTLGVSRRSIAG